MEPHRLTLTLWRKLLARHHSNGRRTGNSSLVHIFRHSFLSSPATQTLWRATDPVLAARGAWGGIFRVDLNGSGESGNISLVVLGDADHASFDNVTFVDDQRHDPGDGRSRRWVARSVEQARLDLGLQIEQGTSGEKLGGPIRRTRPGSLGSTRRGGNEPTGLHVSEGDATIGGLIGTREFRTDRARLFFTQQHGENNLFEVSPLD